MKNIFTSVAVLLIAATTLAQTTPSPASERRERIISIGPVVGFGHSGVRGISYDDLFKPSWNAGITMNYSHSEHIGFSIDVLYSMEGGKYQQTNGNTIDLDLQYLRIPIKFAYFFRDFDKDFRPKVTIGPSLGFLIDDKLDYNQSPSSNQSNVLTHFDKGYNGFDLGGTASIGFNERLADRIWLNVDAYYYQGFLDVGSMNHYNANFGLRAGVAFGL